MTTGGWILMIGSISAVLTLTAWCYRRVLTAPGETTKPPDALGA